MERMSPNQSGTTTTTATDRTSSTTTTETEPTTTTANKTTNHQPDVQVLDDDDPLLTTDCPSYIDAIRDLNAPRISSLLSPPKVDDGEGGGSESSSQNITIESIKGHSDEEDFDDDRSSVVTESSCSEYGDHGRSGGCYHEGLKSTANSLAIDAINCASDELQGSKGGVICVNSELRASTAGSLNSCPDRPRIGQQNNGYVMSEVARPRSSRNGTGARNGKELALINGQHSQVVPKGANGAAVMAQQSLSSATSPSGQTTAIFQDSTDITLGNKTFITGSLTIKQYIKDVNPQGASK